VITWSDPEKAPGVHPGDAVLSIDGRPAREVVEDSESRISATTPQHRRARTLPNLAIIHKDVELRLEIQPFDGPAKTVTLRQFFLQHLTDRPLYSEHFLVTLATRPDQRGVTWLRSHWTMPPLQPRLKGKLAFLIGAETFSAGDTFAEIVDTYKLGALVGSPTAGITGNVNMVELPGKYRLIWTGMKVLKQDGSLRHGVAIQPTVPVAPMRRGRTSGVPACVEPI